MLIHSGFSRYLLQFLRAADGKVLEDDSSPYRRFPDAALHQLCIQIDT
jgi:hypothetical protein